MGWEILTKDDYLSLVNEYLTLWADIALKIG